MLPVLIKATYNDYFNILHFTDRLSSLSKEIQYRAICAPPLPLVTLLSYKGAAVAEWLSFWLAEQEDRFSIPGLATWIFRDWLAPATKSRYG